MNRRTHLRHSTPSNEIRGSNYNDGIMLSQEGSGSSNVRFLDNLVVGQTNVAGAPGGYVVDVSNANPTFTIAVNTAASGGIGVLVAGRDDLGASWTGTVANNIVSGMTGGSSSARAAWIRRFVA